MTIFQVFATPTDINRRYTYISKTYAKPTNCANLALFIIGIVDSQHVKKCQLSRSATREQIIQLVRAALKTCGQSGVGLHFETYTDRDLAELEISHATPLYIIWKDGSAHLAALYRQVTGIMILYEPQLNKHFIGDDITKYFQEYARDVHILHGPKVSNYACQTKEVLSGFEEEDLVLTSTTPSRRGSISQYTQAGVRFTRRNKKRTRKHRKVKKHGL